MATAQKSLQEMRPSETIDLFNVAERAGADADACAAGRWTCYMLLGDFEKAWQESDAITKRGRPDRNKFWDGEPLTGRRILVRCLHGLGDTLQFARYLPLARQLARSVTLEAQPALKALLKQSSLADEVITWGEPGPAWDRQIEVVEFPRIFRTTVDAIPNRIPYIKASPGRALLKDTGRLRVGLVWASGGYNPARSMRLDDLAAILDVPNTEFYSLQGGEEASQLTAWSHRVDSANGYLQITGAAELVAELDLVITVDTMMAHLAGAIGKAVWTLLPFESDWRWMLDRADSPWYPTMRLFRQKHRGVWSTVVQQVRQELELWAAKNWARNRRQAM